MTLTIIPANDSCRIVDSSRAAAVKTLAQVRDQGGRIPRRDLEAEARRLGVTVEHLRRLVREYRETGRIRSKPPSNPHKIVLPDVHRAQVLYFVHRGVAAKAFDALKASGDLPDQMDLRTFQRRVNEWDPALRACAKFGYREMVKHQFFNIEHIPYRGYAFGTDHTSLPIMVLPDRGSTKPVWPWLTTVVDLKTRVVLSYKLTLHTPNTEDSLDALVEAVDGWCTEDGMFVGGKPDFIRSDRGGDYISEALSRNLINLEIERQFTEPYSSWQNGRVERINGTLDADFAPTVPGFHPGGEAEYTRRVLKTPLQVSSLITFETLDRRIEGFFADYNNRVHSKLNGRTPLVAWADDTHPIHRADEGTIVHAMSQRATRTLQRYGIEIRGTIYSSPLLARLRKQNVRQVEVRYHEHDRDHIKVFVDGIFEGTATKTELQSDEAKMGVLSIRSAQRRLMERLTREADYQRVLNERERQREEGIPESEWPALPAPPETDDDHSGDADRTASGPLTQSETRDMLSAITDREDDEIGDGDGHGDDKDERGDDGLAS